MNFPMLDLKRTGEIIKRLRLKNNLTRTELAKKMYITYCTVYTWEKGIRCPDIENLIILAHIFNVTVNDILVINERRNDE